MKYRSQASGAVSICLLAALWGMVIVPGLLRAVELRARIANVDREPLSRPVIRPVALKTDAEYERSSALFGALLSRPQEAEHSEYLLLQAHQLSATARVRLRAAQPQPASGRGLFTRFGLQVQLEGDMAGMTDLLLLLRQTRPRIDVERVSLRAGPEPQAIDAQMVLSTYAWAPPAAQGARSTQGNGGRNPMEGDAK